MGGSTNDPLEGKFQGGGRWGIKTKEPSVGAGHKIVPNTDASATKFFTLVPIS